MLIRNGSLLGIGLNSNPARRAFLEPLLRTDGPLVSREEVISVVDDNPSIRTAVKRLIQSAELIVEEFESAEEFLLSRRCQDSACLILDLRLSGMSGFELQKQLRVSNPSLPIIFMSAHDDEVTTARGLRSGAIEFLHKPIDEEALFAAINFSLLLFRSRGSGSATSLRIDRGL